MTELQVVEGATRISLAVRGEVDRDGVDQLRVVLAEAGRRPSELELDLVEVTRFPRLGLALLVSARRFFGDRLHVRCTPEIATELADAGLDRLLPLSTPVT
jgi:ABC-type transporter Mla MlaB component